MVHTYHITGMTCSSCEAKVKDLLMAVKGVSQVSINLNREEAEIAMEQHIPTGILQKALASSPKYTLSDRVISTPLPEEVSKTWIQTYKPVLLIFLYITIITLVIQLSSESFSYMQWMNHFMAGFFLTFSFFKFLNIKGFADSYAMYDILAMQWKGYGYLYAVIEFLLGIAYISGFKPLLTNTVTFIVMSISLVGVLRSVLNHKKIKCACLGDVFNLPMSTITIIEDGLMIVMSLAMVLYRIIFY